MCLMTQTMTKIVSLFWRVSAHHHHPTLPSPNWLEAGTGLLRWFEEEEDCRIAVSVLAALHLCLSLLS